MKIKYLLLIVFVLGTNSVFAYTSKVDSLMKLGNNLMTLHKYNDAAGVFGQVLQVDKDHPDALFNKGLAHYYVYEYDSALTLLNHLEKVTHNIADVYNLRGMTYVFLKDTTKAMADFNKAIELDNKFSEAYGNRGALLNDLGKTDQAYKDLSYALSYDSSNSKVLLEHGKAAYKKDKYSEAIRDFTLLLAKGGVSGELFQRRADAFYKNGNYIEAIDDYNKVLYLNPIDLVALNNLSFAYEAAGDSSQSKNVRRMVDEILYAKSLDPDTTKLVIYSTPDSIFSINLPQNFNQFYKTDKDSTIAYYMVDPINPDNYRIGMKVIVRKYEGIRSNTTSSEDLLEKWRMIRDTVSYEGVYRNDIFTRRHKLYRDYPTYLTQFLFQKNVKSEPVMRWEYAIAYGLHLIEIYITFPMTFYGYYSPIFEKSIDSFNIKMLGQF